MSAHYVWNEGIPHGANLRSGLAHLRQAQHLLLDELAAMNQMSNQQIADAFGFADATAAGSAKSELASDVTNLQGGDGTGSSGAGRALQQLLDQFA